MYSHFVILLITDDARAHVSFLRKEVRRRRFDVCSYNRGGLYGV